MSDVNVVVVKGRLGGDPKVDYLQSGLAKASFTVANNRRRKDDEKTNWIPVVMFGRRAEVIGEYFSKGQEIVLQGEFTVDQWTDKETGKMRSRAYLLANDFSFSNGNKKGGGGTEPAAAKQNSQKSKKSIDFGEVQFEDEPKSSSDEITGDLDVAGDSEDWMP